MAHILVIDDDERMAERAAQGLIDAGHACGWVGDAETAMKVISRRRPDLLLLEENLPGERGTTLLRRLRNSPKLYDLPVIMMTSSAGFKEEQIAYYNGVQDYIRKPFSELLLQCRVKELLEARGDRPAHRPLAEVLGMHQAGTSTGTVRRIC